MKRLFIAFAAVAAFILSAPTAAAQNKALINLPLQHTTIVGAELDIWTVRPVNRWQWFSLSAQSFTGEDLATNKAAAGGSLGIRVDGLGAFLFAGFSGYSEPSTPLVWGKFTVTIGGRF
jgi:hypothetical protein